MDGYVNFAAIPKRIAVCPVCESGELVRCGAGDVVRCTGCERTLVAAILETILAIASLPDAAGSHACECGHPEMRPRPDGVFHCPACGSEVLPTVPGTRLA